MGFDLNYLGHQLPALWRGLLVTIEISAISIVLSLIVGSVGACARALRVPVLGAVFAGYVELIRNSPLLVQIFFVFFGLPVVGLKLPLFWSGVLALTLWAGAFQTENIRGGLEGVGRGLREAAMALGLTTRQYLRFIGLPMAFRMSVPPMLNTCVSLIKNSAYLSAIGLQELSGVAFDRIAEDFRAFEMLAAVLVGYLVIVLSLSAAVRALEHRLQAPFRA